MNLDLERLNSLDEAVPVKIVSVRVFILKNRLKRRNDIHHFNLV